MIHPTLQTQSPDAKEPADILDTEQWSHRAVGREQKEKTHATVRSFGYSSQARTHDVRTFFTKCSRVKQGRSYSTLCWPLHLFWGSQWYERSALAPLWQHHLSKAYQPASSSDTELCLGQTGNSWWGLHYSMAAEDSPALQESSAAAFTLPPLFCKRVYISFEEAVGLIN